MASAAYVGRIGVLAIMLGVSAAVTAGAASADPGERSPGPGPTVGADPARVSGVAATGSRRGSAPHRSLARTASGNDRAVSPRTIRLTQPSSSPVAVPAPVPAQRPTPPRPDPVPVTAAPAPGAAVVAEPVAVQTSSSAPTMQAAKPVAAARGLASLLGPGTDGAVDSPVNWVVLAAARRAIPTGLASAVANQPPAITKVVLGIPNSTTGAVAGTVTAADPNGDAITYKASTSAKGSVSITTAGVFTYTPTATARHAAAKLGSTATTDSVTVTVTDAKGAATSQAVTVPILGKNSAPTATKTIGTADPATGVVTGRISGTDADTDPLTYIATAAPTGGTVVVSPATGTFTYTPTATTRTSTTVKADTFTVTVADGYGGSVAVPVAVGVGVNASLSTFCGCTLMPANTVFHADVSSLPVLAKSSTWTALLGGKLFAAWGGNQWMGHTAGMPVNVVGATRPTEKVIFNRGYTTSGPSIDATPYAIPDRPLVEGMPATPAWDRHLLVFQEGTCISQELYNVANGVELPATNLADALGNAVYVGTYGSAWIAEAGGHVDMNSPLYPAIGWANASRLPYLPLMLRPDDLSRGSIDHMLGIAIAKDRGTGYTWPARAGDGTGVNPDGVPMGTVFRLRADFDISKYDPATQVVLRALQQHGAVVYDSTNPGQSGATLLAMSNGWTGTSYLTVQQQLRTIPMSAFEAVDVLSLAADPAVGWVVRSTV